MSSALPSLISWPRGGAISFDSMPFNVATSMPVRLLMSSRVKPRISRAERIRSPRASFPPAGARWEASVRKSSCFFIAFLLDCPSSHTDMASNDDAQDLRRALSDFEKSLVPVKPFYTEVFHQPVAAVELQCLV